MTQAQIHYGNFKKRNNKICIGKEKNTQFTNLRNSYKRHRNIGKHSNALK